MATSSSSTSGAGRPATSTNRLVTEIRAQIVEGRLEPGQQLPTRVEIERHYGAGPATVQKALEQLRRDGFVQARGKQGTYVADNPPHLTRYAIAFPTLPTERAWNRFWTALSNQIITMERGQYRPEGLRLPIYYGLGKRSEAPDFLQLEQDVQSHCLAGLICMSSPHFLERSQVMADTALPKVAITTYREGGVPTVTLNFPAFQSKALDYLKARGRRRIALLSPVVDRPVLASWHKAIEERGQETQPYWFHQLHTGTPDAAQSLMHLMMRPGQDMVPDGIIIADDNLVDHALAGLLAAGVHVPEQVDVVAHCNFPWHSPSVLPVERLGFDVREIIAACIENLNGQRRGENVPRATFIAPHFAEEVHGAWISPAPTGLEDAQ